MCPRETKSWQIFALKWLITPRILLFMSLRHNIVILSNWSLVLNWLVGYQPSSVVLDTGMVINSSWVRICWRLLLQDIAMILLKSCFHEKNINCLLFGHLHSLYFNTIFIIRQFSSDFRYFIQVLWTTLNQNFTRGRNINILVGDWLPAGVIDGLAIVVCVVCIDGVVGETLGVDDVKNIYFYKLAPYWQWN